MATKRNPDGQDRVIAELHQVQDQLQEARKQRDEYISKQLDELRKGQDKFIEKLGGYVTSVSLETLTKRVAFTEKMVYIAIGGVLLVSFLMPIVLHLSGAK